MRNLEQELKLLLTQREYEILNALSPNEPQLQTNYYFSQEGMSPETMVRLREKNGEFVLCFKKRLQQTNGISVCDERECEVEVNFAQNLIRRGIMSHEINMMLKTDFDGALGYVGQLQTYRKKYKLDEWQFELDKNLYLNRCDYELECECSNVQQLLKLENYLAFNYGITIRYSQPKVQRFWEALNTNR